MQQQLHFQPQEIQMPKGKGYSMRNPPAQVDKMKSGGPKSSGGKSMSKSKGKMKMKMKKHNSSKMNY